MLSPEQLKRMPERLVQAMEDLEAEILTDICNRLWKSGTVTEGAIHQIKMLAEQGYSQDYIEERIQETLAIGQKEIDRMFQEAVDRNNEYLENAAKKLGKPELVAPEREWRGALNQQVEAIRKQTQDEFKNITQSMGFAIRRPGQKPEFLPAAKTYQRIMDRVTLEMTTGTTDYETAIRRAVTDLANSGLQIQYVDYFKEGFKKGKSFHRDHADVAARRAIMTGMSQVAHRMTENAMDVLETEYVEVEAHIGARDIDGPMGWENHKKWQGRVYRWNRKGGG